MSKFFVSGWHGLTIGEDVGSAVFPALTPDQKLVEAKIIKGCQVIREIELSRPTKPKKHRFKERKK